MLISMTSTPPAPTNDTRDRILDAAERLFVENGFDGTSMRMITGAANANLAAINYHFGGKDALVQEVFRRRLAALNARRLDELDRLEAEAAGAPLKPSRIVEAFFGTALELAADTEHGGRTFMRLLARTYNEPNAFVRQFLAEEYAEVMDRFLGALFRALPEVPRAEILWRFHFMIGAMAFAIAGLGGLSELMEVGPQDEDPARLLPRLMSFLLGGLRAPLPDSGLQG
ncbi:TetR/AcrR family transcriptional regulator [Thauera aminoaromatica]|jgi:AcrR family transcriptional regulator|uniref:TetR family transcriptional regulator n=1 Tax=Thauera aminoaromatica S2 TaxID=1234381 RepID=N6YZ78_THASP|nr:TetR family transcriptional regulator [Thauera aminoaromatica]ENO87702.1 TetR family transcriptional regulator [Thauera aminoaromatica S2]